MDKLTTISATLFMAADVFAIVSLALPDWIITESGTGKCNRYGSGSPSSSPKSASGRLHLFIPCRRHTAWTHVDLHDTI